MCSRVTLRTPLEALQDLFGFEGGPALGPRYNVPPSEPLLALRVPESGDGARQATLLRWGIPRRTREAPGAVAINARSETAATSPLFRTAMERQRCAVLVDGFYEWRQEGRIKQPFLIARADGRPFALAGLVGPAAEGDPLPGSCAVLTTSANELVAPVHDRMPAILRPDELGAWLDPARPAESVAALLRPFPAPEMSMRRVSVKLNNPRHDGPEVLAPAEQGRLF